MYARLISHSPHDTIESVNLFDKMSLTNTTDARIAAHHSYIEEDEEEKEKEKEEEEAAAEEEEEEEDEREYRSSIVSV